jgi:putative transposase
MKHPLVRDLPADGIPVTVACRVLEFSTRQFRADRPNQLWLTDITEHRTDAGKLYLCAIKDIHSKRIVGYSMDDRMTSAFAVSAVRNADRAPRAGRHDPAFRPRVAISIERLRADAQEQRTDRVDGTGRRLRRQRRDGVLLRTSAEKRPRLAEMGNKGGPATHHRDLDLADLPPQMPPTSTQPNDTGRIRNTRTTATTATRNQQPPTGN